jgi:hypothetical protein
MNDVIEHLNSEKNKEFYKEKKEELLKIFDSYKNQ